MSTPGFQTTKEVVLTNTSEIPMTFTLHVPGSGDPSDPVEFEILPESGTLPPNFHQVIQVCASCYACVVHCSTYMHTGT